jgi:hypothetical protein
VTARSAVGVALAGCVLWALATLVRPDTTLHLAPVFAAAAPAVVARLRHGAGLPGREALLAGLIGFVVVSAAALGLHLSGLLEGPSLLPAGSAVHEALAGALVGANAAVVGTASGARRADGHAR